MSAIVHAYWLGWLYGVGSGVALAAGATGLWHIIRKEAR